MLLTAWQEVPKTAIAGLLDTVRTRILTMAIDIKNGFEESGEDLSHIKQNSPEAEKVQRTVINNIYGGEVHIAAGNQLINTQNISVEKWEDLRNVLKAAGIEDEDLTELSQAIEKDDKKVGSGVKGWISRNAGKVFAQGLQVGATVGTTILTAKIKQYLGLT